MVLQGIVQTIAVAMASVLQQEIVSVKLDLLGLTVLPVRCFFGTLPCVCVSTCMWSVSQSVCLSLKCVLDCVLCVCMYGYTHTHTCIYSMYMHVCLCLCLNFVCVNE